MIDVQQVSKMFSRSVYALRGLSLHVDKGEFVFLTGPSGAGKSTLLRLLLRQDVPSEGRVIVGGRDLAQQVHDLEREIRIEVACRFIRENDDGIVDERARDRDALLFSA